MIPKIIHYSWFSGEPFPPQTEYYIKKWKELLPDYEFILWDKESLITTKNKFALEAAGVTKWAFAADFIRLYAVYNYGGIWMDTDVELFKSFDPYLNDRLFIGGEANYHGIPKKRYLTSHCFGAEKGHPFLELCLSYYSERHFILSKDERLPESLRYDMTILPEIQAKIAALFYEYDANGFMDIHQILQDGMHVYPSDYFDNPRFKKVNNVVCIHHAEGGWRNLPNSTSSPLNQLKTARKNKRYYQRQVIEFVNKTLLRFHLYLSRVQCGENITEWAKK